LRRRLVALLTAGLLAGCATPSRTPLAVDLLISGGTIYPGGAEPFTGEIAVSGDRIVAVGPDVAVTAARTIVARGMIVAPGFIDPHTHMEGWLTADDARRRLVEPFLMQGVTTAFVGNDGGGPIEVGKLLDSARTKPVGINYATFTGFGSIREKIIGSDRRAPNSAELKREEQLVRDAMCEGAMGLSTGLFYAPQSFSKTDEVVALAKVAAAMGGTYDTHLRDEANYNVGLAAAVDEAITIARDARIPVHISHIKALGVDVQGMAPAIIARIEAARSGGLNVTAGQYPWQASGTSLVASLIPLWAQDGGRSAMLARFDDPELATRLKNEIAENLRRRGGAEMLLIVEGRWKGRRLDAVAKALGTDPVAAAMATIRVGDPATISFNMAEGDIEAFMRQPWTMTDSDASTAHPRIYGSFARKYDVYVRERHVLGMREFIDRSSALTADWFGIKDRGHLRPGAFADVVVFDPAHYASRATYEQPDITAAGVRAVLVNGRLAVDHGQLTGEAAGRALAHAAPAAACQ
jgi:N-acyl-D-aspartate/D-glutamate deacylase